MKFIYKNIKRLKISVLLILISYPYILNGYIGPGVGFAFFGTFIATFIAIILIIFSLLSLPVRILINLLRKKRTQYPPITKRAIIIGMDGLDHKKVGKFILDNKLPNFKMLAKIGDFKILNTTTPALSPVAWSTFQTGTNPAKHNIFDFLKRKSNSYQLENADSSLFGLRKKIHIGKYIIPLSKPHIRPNRMGKTFWDILGEYNIFCSILKVPITFPPVRLRGVTISGLGVPDLIGTQGEFIYYTEDKEEIDKRLTGGKAVVVEKKGNLINSYIPGPPSPFRVDRKNLKIPFQIDLQKKNSILKIQGRKFELKEGKYTDWIELKFRALPFITITGITKFLLKGKEPFKLYLTPINISPKNPAMPISSPKIYSRFLYHLHGNFATLGFAEDTWALMNGIISREEFLEQCYSNHKERERIFLQSLLDFTKGATIVVFDISDRIQHMFLNDTEQIEILYKRMDNLLGEVLKSINDDTLLLLLSDHGFKEFRWEFNVNGWLKDMGYLSLKEVEEEVEYFKGVDWEKTRAYSYGYTNIYLNLKNREPQGVVQKKEILSILRDIKGKLKNVKNPSTGENVFKEIYLKDEIYNGPYKKNAPEIILGYNVGYRTSWDSIIGKIGSPGILSENKEKWVGDHSFNPDEVPGVLLSNKKIEKDSPNLQDIAPTILDAFGILIPDFIDGDSLLRKEKIDK